MEHHTAVICLASRLDATTLARYDALRPPPGGEKLICLDRSSGDGCPTPAGVAVEGFTLTGLRAAGYRPISNALVPGSNHFPVIERAATGAAGFTWCVEYDVEFDGRWDAFFEAHGASDADLLAALVMTRADDPGWYWWPSLRGPCGEPPRLTDQQIFRSFNPVYRISRRGAAYLRSMYHAGWQGHHEVSMATLLTLGGYRVEDLGGTGRHVRPENHGKWYTAKSYRYRPPVAGPDGAEPHGLLFHPVKSLVRP